MDSQYLLPDDGRQFLVHVSGGRTSGFMFRQILDAHGGRLPNYARAVFCNTGKEREETLAFLGNMIDRWHPLAALEYTYRQHLRGGRHPARQKNWFREVTVDRHPRLVSCSDGSGAQTIVPAASRNGEPFIEMIRSRQQLPNVVMRSCTTDLKVRTANRWARHELGWKAKDTWSVLGIRYDEPRRWKKALWDECHTVYPMVDARATVDDVFAFWSDQAFDLGLRPDQSNCDLCFLKGAAKLRTLIGEEPERAAWWIEQESYRADGSRGKARDLTVRRFMKRRSYDQLRGEALSMLPFEEKDDDHKSVSCFCGD